MWQSIEIQLEYQAEFPSIDSFPLLILSDGIVSNVSSHRTVYEKKQKKNDVDQASVRI